MPSRKTEAACSFPATLVRRAQIKGASGSFRGRAARLFRSEAIEF